MRDYLYIPLGGNRRGTARTYLHLMLTMFLGGLWHGASWNFVLWGGLHGGLLAGERCLRDLGFRAPPEWLRRGLVFLVVVIAWVPFKLDTLPETLRWLARMSGARGLGQVGWEAALGALVFCGLVWLPIAPRRLLCAAGSGISLSTRQLSASVCWCRPSPWDTADSNPPPSCTSGSDGDPRAARANLHRSLALGLARAGGLSLFRP